MINLAGKLKNRVEVYGRIETVSESGAVKYDYGFVKKVWAAVTPCLTNINVLGTKDRNYEGIAESTVAMKFKFLMRIDALNVQNDMYFVCKGQKYDVMYSIPYFKDGSYMEVYTTLRIENDDNTFKGEDGYAY